MFKKTTLSILVASMLVTACAGNNIKQQENNIDKSKSAKNIEITKTSEEIVLSDFPVESTTNETDIIPAKTEITQSKPIIKTVNFKFDNFELSDKSKLLIKQHAEFLVANPTYVLSINGHSDYRGPEVYNEKLSLRRANSVASLLMSYGAPESQLVINSFGASQPVEDYDNWFQNRRVEFEYSELYIVSK